MNSTSSQITISTPILTTSNYPSTFSSPPITTTSSLKSNTFQILTTLLPRKTSKIPFPTILTTNDQNFTFSDIESTTEFSTISLSPPILTTIEENVRNTSKIPFPTILTTTNKNFTFQSEMTTSSKFSTTPLPQPNITTIEEKNTEPQTTKKSTSSYTLPPPTILTTSDYTKSPTKTSSDPITTQSPTIKSTISMFFPTNKITTDKHENPQTSTESHQPTTHSIITSSKIPSTSIPTIKTSQIPGKICPNFPEICPINNNSNFGDNNIDPRLVRPKRQIINGCPCIDIRSALKLLLQNGMLGNIKHELLEEIKDPEAEEVFKDEIEIIPIIYPKNRLAWN